MTHCPACVRASAGLLPACTRACAHAHAGAAGFVLLALTNFVLLIVLGKDVGFEPDSVRYQAAKASGIQFQTSAPV